MVQVNLDDKDQRQITQALTRMMTKIVNEKRTAWDENNKAVQSCNVKCIGCVIHEEGFFTVTNTAKLALDALSNHSTDFANTVKQKAIDTIKNELEAITKQKNEGVGAGINSNDLVQSTSTLMDKNMESWISNAIKSTVKTSDNVEQGCDMELRGMNLYGSFSAGSEYVLDKVSGHITQSLIANSDDLSSDTTIDSSITGTTDQSNKGFDPFNTGLWFAIGYVISFVFGNFVWMDGSMVAALLPLVLIACVVGAVLLFDVSFVDTFWSPASSDNISQLITCGEEACKVQTWVDDEKVEHKTTPKAGSTAEVVSRSTRCKKGTCETVVFEDGKEKIRTTDPAAKVNVDRFEEDVETAKKYRKWEKIALVAIMVVLSIMTLLNLFSAPNNEYLG